MTRCRRTPLDLLPGAPAPSRSSTADCSRCFALCCVLLPYSGAAGFGADKPGGVACPTSPSDDRCTHPRGPARAGLAGVRDLRLLRGRPAGVPGDVRRHVLAGARRPRRDGRGALGRCGGCTRCSRTCARSLRRTPRARGAGRVGPAAGGARRWTPVELLDPRPRRAARRGAATSWPRPARGCAATAPDLRRADLAGADLRGRDLRDAGLRGALLIGADLRGRRPRRGRPAGRRPPGHRRTRRRPRRRPLPHPAAGRRGPR